MNIDKHLSQPGIELPPPETVETPIDAFPEQQDTPFSSEKESRAVELAQPVPTSSPKPATNIAPISPPPLLTDDQSSTAIATDHASTGDIPEEAADIDVIEKIWVAKAKELIDKTKDDPHTQKAQMSKFKAEYIKKRINKEIKISEG